MTEHRVFIEEDQDDGRRYWTCDCGHSGSAWSFKQADIYADNHIPDSDTRIDVSRQLW